MYFAGGDGAAREKFHSGNEGYFYYFTSTWGVKAE